MNITHDLTLDYALAGEHAAYLRAITRFRHSPRQSAIVDEPDPVRAMADIKCGPEGQGTALTSSLLLLDPASLARPPEGEPDQLVPWIGSTEDPSKIVWSGLECMTVAGYVGWLKIINDNALLPWGYKLSGVSQIILNQGLVLDITVKDGAVSVTESKTDKSTTNYRQQIKVMNFSGLTGMNFDEQQREAAAIRAPRGVGGNYYGFSSPNHNEWIVVQAPTATEAERCGERDLGMSFAPGAWNRNPIDFGNRIGGVRDRRLQATIYRADGRSERTTR